MLTRFLSRFWYLVAFALYLPIFVVPLPPQFLVRGIAVADEALLILFCGLILLAFHREGWQWKTLALTSTLILFTLPLLRVWQTAANGNNFILGLLPFIDAQGYYSDAIRLIGGRLFENQGAYRPLFSVFLAALLKLSDGNLQFSVGFMAFLFGLGAYSLSSEVRNSFGAWTGAAVIVFLQFFYRQFAGATMTEQLGLPMGAFGLTALLQSARKENRWLFLAGIFLASFALMSRAGAYFVVPAFMLYGWKYFTHDKKSFLVNAALIFLVAIAPFVIDSQVRNRVTPPSAVIAGNFAFHLYGQARGGEGWRDIYQEHPELKDLPMTEVGQVAYQLAFDEMKQNPFGLAQGALSSWVKFFTPIYLFDVFQTYNPYVNIVLQFIGFFLFLAGLWFAWKNRKTPVYALLLTGLIGTLVSVPFIPPWDGGPWWGGIRIHSATMGLHLSIAGIGLAGLVRSIPARPARAESEATREGGESFWALGFVLAAAILVAPFAIQSSVETLEPASIVCLPNEMQARFPLSSGAFLTALEDDSARTYVPEVRVSDVKQSLRGFDYGQITFILRRINEDAVFLMTNDLLTGRPLWIVGPPQMANRAGETVEACGVLTDIPVTNVPDFFYVTDFR
ncbi:MAG: hypothetical protein AB1750_12345 [Chloroflexota bacterium]